MLRAVGTKTRRFAEFVQRGLDNFKNHELSYICTIENGFRYFIVARRCHCVIMPDRQVRFYRR